MLMTIKNKMMLAMDSLITEAKKKGGVPAEISLEPSEAVNFLKECRELKILCNKNVSIKDRENNEREVCFYFKAELTTERLKHLIKEWHTKEIMLFYKDIKLRVVQKKLPDVPEPITDVPELIAPLGRIIKEGSISICDECGSSLHRKYLFFVDGCIQPKCNNYYRNLH